MKKLILVLAIFTSGLLCQTSFAQVTFRANITTQPIWGPTGYDHVEYYYLPDIEAYYYVPRHKFIYREGGNWVSRSSLPSRNRNFDIYDTRKVVVNDPKPYLNHAVYKARYESNAEHTNQQSIRDSHESKYFENKNHPEHSKWKESQRNKNNEKHYGSDRETRHD
jgi:hypothetical protein